MLTHMPMATFEVFRRDIEPSMPSTQKITEQAEISKKEKIADTILDHVRSCKIQGQLRILTNWKKPIRSAGRRPTERHGYT